MLLKPVDGIISGHIDRELAWRVLSLALSRLAIGAPSGIAILTFHPAQVLAHGKIVGGSRTVLLEPGRCFLGISNRRQPSIRCVLTLVIKEIYDEDQ
jgi:hypothetical protein